MTGRLLERLREVSPPGGDVVDKAPDPLKDVFRRRRGSQSYSRRRRSQPSTEELDPTEKERQEYIAHLDDNEVFNRLKYHYKKRGINIVKNKEIPYPLLPNLSSKKEDAMTSEEKTKYRREGEIWRLNQLNDFDEMDYEKEIKAKRDDGTEAEQLATRRIPKTKEGKLGYETSLAASKDVYKPVSERHIQNAKLDKKLSDEENSVYVENGGRNVIWANRGTHLPNILKDVFDDLDIGKGMVLTALGKSELIDKLSKFTDIGSRKRKAEELLVKIKDKYKNKKLHIAGHSLGGEIVKHILYKNPNDKTIFGYGFNSAHHRKFHNKQLMKEDERYKGYRSSGSVASDIVSSLGDSGYLSTKYIKSLNKYSIHNHYIDGFPDKKPVEKSKVEVDKARKKRYNLRGKYKEDL
jgi:hypothetical protein